MQIVLGARTRMLVSWGPIHLVLLFQSNYYIFIFLSYSSNVIFSCPSHPTWYITLSYSSLFILYLLMNYKAVPINMRQTNFSTLYKPINMRQTNFSTLYAPLLIKSHYTNFCMFVLIERTFNLIFLNKKKITSRLPSFMFLWLPVSFIHIYMSAF